MTGIIAVDFDGTIFKKIKFPGIGEPVPGAIETIKALKAAGHEVVLWTCRKGKHLELAKERLSTVGLEFDYYNEHPAQDHLSNKLDADIFIDDKGAGCPVVEVTSAGKTEKYVSWTGIQAILRREGFL